MGCLQLSATHASTISAPTVFAAPSPPRIFHLPRQQPALRQSYTRWPEWIHTGNLPTRTLSQARRDSVELLDALGACVGPACVSMAAAPAATEASKISPWSNEGRVHRQAAAAAAAAASELRTLVEAERRTVAADASALASPAALRLAQHLRAARGCLPMLGVAVPLCRSAAFTAAALVASGLATDERLGAAHGRWSALANANEAAFDAARQVLDAPVGVVA